MERRNNNETSPETRGAIIALHYKGLSNGDVARCTGVSKVTVARWIRRYKTTGTTMDQPRIGRPRCTTPQQDKAIAAAVRANPFSTATAIRMQHQIPCTPQTIRNRLHTIKLHGRTPEDKSELNECKMEERMEYALEYADKPCKFWDSVIFCSEKTFCSCSYAVNKVWCRKSTRYEPKKVDGTQRSGRICAGMFGWMHAAGVGELTDVGQGRFTGNKYVELLEEVLLPSVRAMLFPEPTPFYLVQDNSPVHSSNVVKSWFQDHPEITLLPHPPKSPDLNPIENIWGMMIQNLSLDNPVLHSRATMVNRVKLAWEELRSQGGRDMTAELVASMPCRLNSVIDAGGAYTKY